MKTKSLKFTSKRISKMFLTVTMIITMILSQVTVAFADVAWPGPGTNYAYAISYNGGTTIGDASSQLDSSKLTTDYQSIPLDVTFTLTFNNGKVRLSSGSWNPETGGYSTVTNRELIQIQDAQGNVVDDVTVSNSVDTGASADTTVQVHPNKPLKADTTYKLVVKKYFTKVNMQNVIKDVTKSDVILPFKTVALQKPTVTNAVLRGNTLTLEGLPKNQKLKYNLAVDGKFDNNNWTAFDYTEDTANIELSRVNLTADSKIEVGYVKDDNSTPDLISDPVSVFYASTSGPSFTGSVLNGTNLELNGLPKNSANLEYRIAVDGQNYSEWKNLSATGTKGTVSVEGLDLVQNQSIIQVRYKASAPWAASDISQSTFIYGLNTTAPLTQGKDTTFTGGVKVSSGALNTPAQGEENTVTVRNADGELLKTEKNNIGFYCDDDVVLYRASGIYGFTLKGSGDGTNNHVKITIPITLPANHPSDISDSEASDMSKMAVYMLSDCDHGYPTDTNQYWEYVDTVIDKVNKTATVDISNFDSKAKDIILAVKFDKFNPGLLHMIEDSRTDHSFTFNVEALDGSGIRELTIKRMNRNDPSDVKYITLSSKDYPGLRDFVHGDWIKWTDDDVEPGIIYDYIVDSATDMVGNIEDSDEDIVSATLDSPEKMVKDTQEWIYANLKQVQKQELQHSSQYQPYIKFGSGDSQDSVTQPIDLPIKGILHCFGSSSIEWTSDRPDVLRPVVGSNGVGFTEFNLPVDANGNPTEVKVTLTGKITYNLPKTNGEKERETATGIVTVPITVKWDIVDGVVILKTQYGYSLVYNDANHEIADKTYINEPLNEIKKVGEFDNSIADTIAIQHSIDIRPEPYESTGTLDGDNTQNFEIDCHGKTIRADFNGALFNIEQSGGTFTLKNAVIDMNHKNGTFLKSYLYGSKITLENVKIINSENCDYGIYLSAATVASSFTADNCEFSSCKVAAIGSFVPCYISTSYYLGAYHYNKKIPMDVKLSNCTFDGEGKSGYAITDAFDNVSINNCTFKGYKGHVSTGWNSSNDSYEKDYYDADGNNYYLYKGIPDGSPSAAILVKELGTVNLNGNTITNCDNSVIAMTGEKNFDFLKELPADGFVAYCTINGVKVDSTTAEQVVNNLSETNNITEENESKNKIIIADASDRYNLKTILEKVNSKNKYSVNYIAGDNGSIVGNASQQVVDGEDGAAVKAVANPGYHFARWSDGVTTATRKDKIKKDLNVTALFEHNWYKVDYVSGINGSILGNSSQIVKWGDKTTEVTAVAKKGYHFVKWSDGVTTATRKDNVKKKINVTAIFNQNWYKVEYVAGHYGSISGETSQIVKWGDKTTKVTAVAKKGYHFVKWSDGVTTATRQNTVTKSVKLTAVFEKDK